MPKTEVLQEIFPADTNMQATHHGEECEQRNAGVSDNCKPGELVQGRGKVQLPPIFIPNDDCEDAVVPLGEVFIVEVFCEGLYRRRFKTMIGGLFDDDDEIQSSSSPSVPPRCPLELLKTQDDEIYTGRGACCGETNLNPPNPIGHSTKKIPTIDKPSNNKTVCEEQQLVDRIGQLFCNNQNSSQYSNFSISYFQQTSSYNNYYEPPISISHTILPSLFSQCDSTWGTDLSPFSSADQPLSLFHHLHFTPQKPSFYPSDLKAQIFPIGTDWNSSYSSSDGFQTPKPSFEVDWESSQCRNK